MKRHVLAILIAAAACSPEVMGPPTEATIQGTWVLQSVNGQPLPWLMVEGGYRYILRAEELSIAPGGTCRWVSSYRLESVGYSYVVDEPADINDDCTWVLFGSQLLINDSELVGTALGKTMTFVDEDFTLVYRKR